MANLGKYPVFKKNSRSMSLFCCVKNGDVHQFFSNLFDKFGSSFHQNSDTSMTMLIY